jgi:hypothetical protein
VKDDLADMKKHLLRLSCLLLLPLSSFAQGPLNPPGAPAPTMKSLDELDAKLDQVEAKTEKRRPISSLPLTITAPGSYYLTRNLTGAVGQDGITVNADDVTIDLNGFMLAGPGANGIVAVGARIAIRNGTVSGWSQTGITAGAGALVENIRASNNPGRGISAGNNSVVQSCTVTNSGTVAAGRGIAAGTGSLVSKCLVTGTSGANAIAINAASGSTVMDSTARDNAAAGGFGIQAGNSSMILRCESSINSGVTAAINVNASGKIIDCVASGNPGTNSHGITAVSHVLITGCTGGDGININNRCTVTNNSVTENANDGIEVVGSYNRLEGNNVIGNAAVGIKANNNTTAKQNLFIRNSAGANATLNYSVMTGGGGGVTNAFGPIVTHANIGSNTNPHANYDLD